MFQLEIPETTLFDEDKQEFIEIEHQTLELEHSLVSVSKWESKWKKPFISKDEKTLLETLDYIKCMTLTKNVDPLVYTCISNLQLKEVSDYINDKMTATTFTNTNQHSSREIITNEIIYYWMVQAQIPIECENWHLNRLLTLIEVCSRKNAPSKKMSQRDIMARNKSLNAQRKAKLGSRG